MKPSQHTTSHERMTTMADLARWAHALVQLHTRLAPRFARPEPYRRALAYLKGIMSDIARKNGWQIAEQAGEMRPDGMQRLLSSAVWDTDGVRDDVRAYAIEHLGQQHAIVAIDETGIPKRGKKSAGVAVQYCGSTHRVENCQVGVFLSYVTAHGHTLIDRELYLPFDWCEDRSRCHEAGIPEDVHFQTKPQLALQMLARLWQAQVRMAWVVADTVYGGNAEVRSWLEARHQPYVLAVPSQEPVNFAAPSGPRREVAALVELFALHEHEWQRLSMSEGTKGPRLFDWAVLPLLHQWQDDGQHWFLIRRCIDDPTNKAYYFVFAPHGTTLSELVSAIGARWRIEEQFENGKDLGLDQYEVRSFLGWYRHITLLMCVMAYLRGVCCSMRETAPPPQDAAGNVLSIAIALTLPEVRHLLARLLWPVSSSARRVLAWSWWRRCHQARAQACHRQRRLSTG